MPAEVLSKEKKTLVVKTVGQPTKFGDGTGQKLSFSCEDGISYTTFSQSLFPEVTAGATLEADVEQRKSGEFINWILTQVYKDGKGIAEKGKGGYGGGGRSYGKSPQEVHSIEDQVRVKAITELWVGSKIEADDPLVTKLRDWLGKLGAPAPKPAAEPKAEPKAEVKAEKVKEKEAATEPIVGAATLKTLKDVAGANDYSPALMTSIVDSEYHVFKAKDLTEKQAKELIDNLNAGKWKKDGK